MSSFPQIFSLENKVAIVTGALGLIGKNHCEALAEAGANVVVCDLDQTECKNFAGNLQQKSVGISSDITQKDSVIELKNKTLEEFGRIDILVNNAGITRDGLLMTMKDDQLDEIINTNLNSIFRMSKAVIRPMMKKRTGRIINISSVVGATGNPGQTNYAAAKAGLVGFSKSLAREIGSRNITVNTVAPGFIDTDMTRELSQQQKDSLTSQIPLGRLGSPDEIAAAVLFLASPSAAYITGETIHVNGGMYMH